MIQIKLNIIKDPQILASYKHDQGFDLEATEKQIQLAVIGRTRTRDSRNAKPTH